MQPELSPRWYWPLLASLILIAGALQPALACDATAVRATNMTQKTVVAIKNIEPPGAFEIANLGPMVELAWAVAVEQAVGEEWRPIVVEQFELVEQCGEIKSSPCRRLGERAVIRPVPWTGYSCTSQCNTACRANVYYGPGRFRFVIRDCTGQWRVEGPPFELPPFSEGPS